MRIDRNLDLSSLTLEELKALVIQVEQELELKKFEQTLQWSVRQHRKRTAPRGRA